MLARQPGREISQGSAMKVTVCGGTMTKTSRVAPRLERQRTVFAKKYRFVGKTISAALYSSPTGKLHKNDDYHDSTPEELRQCML
jgi:hypothetical protein